MSLKNAFKTIVYTQGKDMTISRRGDFSVSVKVASANYQRNLNGPEDLVIQGREFVVLKEDLDNLGIPFLERGDLIEEVAGFYHTIGEVKIMYVLGNVVGYRLRTR